MFFSKTAFLLFPLRIIKDYVKLIMIGQMYHPDIFYFIIIGEACSLNVTVCMNCVYVLINK